MAVRFRLCIDPGHPSESGWGCQGRRIAEVDLVWQIAVRLERILSKAAFDCRLTKTRAGEKVSNRGRAQRATKFDADLLLRLHCDSGSGTGFAVYFPDRAGRSPDGAVGPSPAVLRQSAADAAVFHSAFKRSLNNGLHDSGVLPDTRTQIGRQQGALTGSIHATQSVLLVEMGVLTNPTDESFLVSSAGQRRMVSALASGCLAVAKSRAVQGFGSKPMNRSTSGR